MAGTRARSGARAEFAGKPRGCPTTILHVQVTCQERNCCVCLFITCFTLPDYISTPKAPPKVWAELLCGELAWSTHGAGGSVRARDLQSALQAAPTSPGMGLQMDRKFSLWKLKRAVDLEAKLSCWRAITRIMERRPVFIRRGRKKRTQRRV